MLTLFSLLMLLFKWKHSRRKEEYLVAPDERQATLKAFIWGVALLNGLFSRPASFLFAHGQQAHIAHYAFQDVKNCLLEAIENRASRP